METITRKDVEMETLASLDVEQIDTTQLVYGRAKKTKPIRVKAMQTLLTDPTLIEKFLLDTIEGHQMLKGGSMVCIGSEGEAWQQTHKGLHKAYNPTLSEDGWVTFEPKPEAEREYFEVPLGNGKFAIKAQWGERQADGTFLQFGEGGDYIFRNADEDHGVDANGQEDVWIVKRNIRFATYELLTPKD
jgi:hypothetical protein